MNNNLFNEYKKCKGYYQFQEDIFPVNFTEKETYNFIKKYFIHAEKESVFDLDFYNDYEQKGKHSHTVSMFFLGLSLKNIITCYLKDIQYETFSYIWFLSCLYHDIAFCQEDICFNTQNQTINLEYYLEKYKIKYNVYNHHWNRINEYKYFAENLIKNYFKYRLNNQKIDHGIIGGYLLFDRLIKNYKNKYNKKTCGNYDKFDTNGHHWEIKHQDYYAIAAQNIINHNIWLVDKQEVISKTYKHYGLSDLIISKNNNIKINIKKSPLLFYFGLLDTIEPTKTFLNNYVLNGISMKYKDDTLIITFDDTIREFEEYKSYVKKVYSTKKWLKLKVYPLNMEKVKNMIKIKFL